MADDDDFVSDAQSLHGDSEEDNSDPISYEEEESEEESDPLNDGEDPNLASDNIDVTQMVNTFKHVQKALSGFTKIVEKFGNPRRSRDQTRSETSTRAVRGRGKGKSNVAAGTTKRCRPGSRFNSGYFGQKIIAKLDDRKRKIIRDRGFGILLEYDGCSAPKGFVQWIADQVDINYGDIVVGGKVIPFDPLSVHLFLGIPIGGEDIKEKYTDSMKTKFLKKLNLTCLPSIKIFGQKLLGDTLSDDDVFRYFMVVALSTFLCANSNTYPSPQYLGALIDVTKVTEWNWSKFVYEWMFSSITNYRKKGRGVIGGCRYFLAGYYLDFLHFGGPKQLPVDMPRILCWKGLMIKKYSSYDCVSGNTYGKRPVKSFDETVYAKKYADEEACANFRNTMDKHCKFIKKKDKDCMYEIFKEHQTRLGYTCPDTLVAKMFKYIHKSYVARAGADANAECESSAGRAASPRHGNGDDEGVDALRDEYEAPLPSPIHVDVLKCGFDPTMVVGTSNTIVKEANVAGAAANSAIMEDLPEIPAPKTNEEVDVAVGVEDQIVENVECKSACAAKSHQRESSATEILESDGLYDGPCNNNCFVSQPTEIISQSNSSHHDSVGMDGKRKRTASTQSCSDAASGPMKRKRRSKGPEASSPHSAVSMSPRKMSLRLSTRLYGMRPVSGVGATVENPLDVDEAPVQTSKSARKGKCKDNSSSPSIEEVSLDVSPGATAATRISKRKRNVSQSSSVANVSPKSRCGPSKQIGRSPLSRVENANDGVKNGEIASSPVVVHSEAAAARPSLDKVEKAPGEGCSISNASASLNQGDDIVSGVRNAHRASTPVPGHQKETQLDELAQRAFSPVIGHQIQTQLDEHAAPAEPQTGKAPHVENHCMKKPDVQFDSPSMPSWRINEDEDDYGNFVEDPKLRRPFPTAPAMSCPVERARSLLRGGIAKSFPVRGAKYATPNDVATDVHQEVNSGQQNWVYVDNLWSNPAVRNEETVVTEIDGTGRTDKVETDHIHMVSLPFTECSETAEASAAAVPPPVPLAAISSTGAPLHIVKWTS